MSCSAETAMFNLRDDDGETGRLRHVLDHICDRCGAMLTAEQV